MNKLLSTALLVLGIGSVTQAQNFVSTAAENKNVILEEFTGLRCTWCPAGHEVANNFKATSPNDVFLINVHEGYLSVPSTGQPDFRTTSGAVLGTQFGVNSYPTGTINRRNFPGNTADPSTPNSTVQSRATWAATGNTVLGEASPVNVAAQATIDMATRELEIIVETYFTAAAGTAPYKLNVALLQNNIEGPQIGDFRYPAAILPNGNYNHQHMLRDLITGQWGVDITSTAMGYFQADTFRYTIPAGFSYQGAPAIPANLADMEVVVFVAEGQQNIITGNEAAMTFVTPPGTSLAQASVMSMATAPTSYCDLTYVPMVTVSNNSTDMNSTIDSVEVGYSLNGAAPVTQMVTTTLAPGGSTNVSFPAIQLAANGENNVVYTIDFESFNSTLINTSAANDEFFSDGPFYTTSTAPSTNDIATTFDGLTDGAPTPANAFADNPDNIRAFKIASTYVNGLNYDLGGFGNSDGCFRWDFPTIAPGLSSMLVYEKVDMAALATAANANEAWLKWSTAYAQISSQNDRLEVLVSTDCGATWTSVYSQAGTNLATASPLNNARFYPQATQWRRDSADLTPYINSNDVLVAYRGTSDGGNCMYIDDIRTEYETAINVNNIQEVATEFELFPNPVQNSLNVAIEVADATDFNIAIQNSLGQTVQQVASQTFLGATTLTVNTSKLPAGVYFVNAVSDQGIVTKRFVVKR
jgi:hypothetical protein